MTTRNIYELAQTWNDGAVDFTAIQMNVTDTASGAGSKLLDLQVGGVSKFSVTKSGGRINFTDPIFGAAYIGAAGARIDFCPGAASGGAKASLDFAGRFCAISTLQIGSIDQATARVVLARDADDVLALRRSTNAQVLNIYNSYTDGSNYERLRMGWSSNVFTIAPEAAGTGSVRVIHLSGLPTSNPGPGILWNNAGTPAIGT